MSGKRISVAVPKRQVFQGFVNMANPGRPGDIQKPKAKPQGPHKN